MKCLSQNSRSGGHVHLYSNGSTSLVRPHFCCNIWTAPF